MVSSSIRVGIAPAMSALFITFSRVVLAAAGYPLNPRKGDAITGLPADASDRMVFHAGTSMAGEAVQVSGGRVLCVTALADTVARAQQRAYEVVDGIHFDGMQCRRDIGYRAL